MSASGADTTSCHHHHGRLGANFVWEKSSLVDNFAGLGGHRPVAGGLGHSLLDDPLGRGGVRKLQWLGVGTHWGLEEVWPSADPGHKVWGQVGVLEHHQCPDSFDQVRRRNNSVSISLISISVICIQVWVVIGRSCSDTNISSHCVLLVFHQPSQVHLQKNSSSSSSSDCSQCPGHHPASGWRSQDHHDCPGGQGRCPTLWLQLPPGLVQFPHQYLCCSHISVGKQKEKVTRQWQCKLYPSEVGH